MIIVSLNFLKLQKYKILNIKLTLLFFSHIKNNFRKLPL